MENNSVQSAAAGPEFTKMDKTQNMKTHTLNFAIASNQNRPDFNLRLPYFSFHELSSAFHLLRSGFDTKSCLTAPPPPILMQLLWIEAWNGGGEVKEQL